MDSPNEGGLNSGRVRVPAAADSIELFEKVIAVAESGADKEDKAAD